MTSNKHYIECGDLSIDKSISSKEPRYNIRKKSKNRVTIVLHINQCTVPPLCMNESLIIKEADYLIKHQSKNWFCLTFNCIGILRREKSRFRFSERIQLHN